MAERTQARRAFTGDRGPPIVPIYTVNQIGPKRRLLPNGSLLCESVPIARAGWLLYGAGEVPLKADPSSRAIYVHRTEDELFRPETIGSFMGSPVVDEHPPTLDGVTPDNWKRLARGFSTTNVRRGEGEDADCLVADLIVSDKEMIRDIQAGKREVSIGYDADYEQTGPGQGQQLNIIGNHIALVEKGRCGPRCAIGDRSTTTEETQMAADKQPGGTKRRRIDVSTLDGLRAAVDQLVNDNDGDDAGDEGSGLHVHVHTGDSAPKKKAAKKDEDDEDDTSKRLDKVEKMVGDIAGAVTAIGQSVQALASGRHGKTGDADADLDDDGKPLSKDKKLTGDSAALSDSYQELASQCEILAPGLKVPTFDSALPRAKTVDRMCRQRKRALDAFSSTPDGAAFLHAITGDAHPDIEEMDCKEVATIFRAGVQSKSAANQRAAVGDGAGKLPTAAQGVAVTGLPPRTSVAELQASYTKHWQTQTVA